MSQQNVDTQWALLLDCLETPEWAWGTKTGSPYKWGGTWLHGGPGAWRLGRTNMSCFSWCRKASQDGPVCPPPHIPCPIHFVIIDRAQVCLKQCWGERQSLNQMMMDTCAPAGKERMCVSFSLSFSELKTCIMLFAGESKPREATAVFTLKRGHSDVWRDSPPCGQAAEN